MKDTVLNLLVFLLVFVGTALVFLITYGLSLALIPGGKGLIFSNPFAAALLPSLLAGLVVAQYRAVRRPGVFPVTWVLLAAGFFLVLTLSIPVIQQMPSVRAPDATPLVPGRFLPLADGSQLLSVGRVTVDIPQGTKPMTVAGDTQYDPWNQRFVFSSSDPKTLGNGGPERTYFQYTPALAGLQTDFLGVYSVLRDNYFNRPFAFWLTAVVVTWLFMGTFFFFSLRTWPLVHVVLILLALRAALMFLVYSFWSLPGLVDLWAPGDWAPALRVWGPVGLIAVAAATLFFMTWLSKPWKHGALS